MTVEGPGQELSSTTPYDAILSRSERQHRLFSVHWELTFRCNEKCTHCYLDVLAPHAPAPGELTTEECLRVIDELADMGVLNLTLSGGEILVRRDLFEILEHARAKRFLVRLYTNGILINASAADRIAALHPYAVEISLYSVVPETHDRITQLAHSWELTVRAIRLLRERGVRTVVKTPLMRENVHEIDAIGAFARELGAGFHYDTTITPKDSGRQEPLQHQVSYPDLVRFFRIHTEENYWSNRVVRDEDPTCGIAGSGLAIDPYGNVTACLQTRFVAGNVREKPLREIWQGSPLWPELRRLTLGELPVCRTCELRTLCVRCHGLALGETGDLRAPALSNCREALARRQALIDRGELRADYPIPAHLERFVETLSDPAIPSYPAEFIPLSALAERKRRGAADAQTDVRQPGGNHHYE